MRVAIVRRAPSASFSMDVYADGLVSGLKTIRPDWEIVELIPSSTPTNEGNTILNGLKKYYQRYWQYPIKVKSRKADIFHIIDHSDGHIAYWLKKANQLTVVTCHDLINLLQPENISDQAKLPLISAAIWKYAVQGIRQANHIVTVSAYTAKDVTQLLNVQPGQITVAPNAVEPLFQPFPPEQLVKFRQRYRISPNTICLLNVGSNHPRKNVFTVLHTLQALRLKELPVHLLKTGADFTVEQKTFLQTHNLESCVTYLGKPSRATLVEIYNVADILMAPSFYEGFGMTVLEAMACGTPVITSNVTSLPEVAGDAAIMVEPTDVNAIVEAVHHLQNDVDYRTSLRQKGLERVRAFTWETTAEQVAQVYESLMPDQALQRSSKHHAATNASRSQIGLQSTVDHLR
ncbi:glycosyltransferase family 4 protein [Phormidium sp. FACHB-592]|uniref:Glycosyltransferase family 4 protein n=1 Tax=Stenomitos frigidus AS-A4 TaxID=2933935 RepID=A0ABV0KM05_9CYAN|nr:glycosyltransferase family 1 protein [Phormidium sp. FACHB-592]MBD2072643.1 glycosyltransferase family 4 protein [Phormidium sp. FACHB-592]